MQRSKGHTRASLGGCCPSACPITSVWKRQKATGGSCWLQVSNYCLVQGWGAWVSAASSQGCLHLGKLVRKSTGGLFPGLGADPAALASPAGPLAWPWSCFISPVVPGHPWVCSGPWSPSPSGSGPGLPLCQDSLNVSTTLYRFIRFH